MSFSDGRKPPISRALVVIVAAVGVLVGVLGYALARFEPAAPDLSFPALVSLSDEADQHSDFDDDSVPVSQKALGDITTQRVLPQQRLRSLPLWHWSPSPDPITWHQFGAAGAGARAPVGCVAGRERLTQLCISRR